MASWSNLPKDVLISIGERLDILHIRSVCSSWRASVPLNLLPLPTLYFPFPGTDGRVKKALKRSSICLFKSPVDPSQAWLGLIFVGSPNREIGIYNPVQGNMVLPMVLDISKLDVQVLCIKYRTETQYEYCLSVRSGACCLNVDSNHDDQFYVLEEPDSPIEPLRLFKTGDEEFITIELEAWIATRISFHSRGSSMLLTA